MTTNNRGRPKAQTPGSGGANGNDDGTPPLGVPDFQTGRDHEPQLPAARGRGPIPFGKQPYLKLWTPTLHSWVRALVALMWTPFVLMHFPAAPADGLGVPSWTGLTQFVFVLYGLIKRGLLRFP